MTNKETERFMEIAKEEKKTNYLESNKINLNVFEQTIENHCIIDLQVVSKFLTSKIKLEVNNHKLLILLRKYLLVNNKIAILRQEERNNEQINGLN